jgi:DNA-binding winged helix-turn-helix (wHTH) protein
LRVPNLIFDNDNGEIVAHSGARVALRAQTLRVMRILFAQRDRVVEKETLIQAAWGGRCVTDDSLTQCIAEIRQALSDHDKSLLQTVHRRGYRLSGVAAPPRETDASHGMQREGSATTTTGHANSFATEASNAYVASIEKFDPNAIMVGAFAAMHDDAAEARIAAQIADEIAAGLATVRSFAITPPSAATSTQAAAITAKSRYEITARIGLDDAKLGKQSGVRCHVSLIDREDARIVLSLRETSASADWTTLSTTVNRIVARLLATILETNTQRTLRDELRSDDVRSFSGRIYALQHLANREATTAVFALIDTALKHFPNDALLWRRYTGACLADLDNSYLGHWPVSRGGELLDIAHRALTLDPFATVNYCYIARALVCVGEFDQALEQAKRGVESSPHEANMRHFYSNVLLRCGDIEGAVREARQAAEWAGFPIHYMLSNLAKPLYFLGRAGEAKALNDEAVRLRPHFPTARMLAALIAHERGEVDAAAAHFNALMSGTTGFSARFFERRFDRVPDIRVRYISALTALGLRAAP